MFRHRDFDSEIGERQQEIGTNQDLAISVRRRRGKKNCKYEKDSFHLCAVYLDGKGKTIKIKCKDILQNIYYYLTIYEI